MLKWIIILFLLSSPLLGQEWINVSPFSDNLVSISGCFISANEGWIFDRRLDADRELYYTSDGGDNWELIFTLTNYYARFFSISMTDPLNGWLALTNDYYSYISFFKTSDGGHTWQNMEDHIIDIEDVSSYHFIDDNIGFISTCVYTDSLPNLYKTIDGGYSWESIEVPPMYVLNNPVNYRITTFFFLNDSIGWAGCHYEWAVGNVLYTSDAGENWIAMDNSFSEVSAVQSVTFITEQIGVLLCYGCLFPYVLLTTDNCVNYTWLDLPGYENAINFQNDSTIWITESSGGIYRSTDLGDTFILEYLSDSYINDIYCFNNIGYFLGSNNTLLKFTYQLYIDDDLLPSNDYLFSTFPNPFNPSTTISFSILEDSKVELNVCNVKGQIVKTIVNNNLAKGEHIFTWNGTDKSGKTLSSGVYFYKLNINDRIEVMKKCLLLK
ncbi:MAG: T9SS type A sorting domain-containing protein [Candidatus Cloacimonetes bacterium]|nr:T9SS type A sorting domain-containing protein [Candidatus Cloacimonadota bacterium]